MRTATAFFVSATTVKGLVAEMLTVFRGWRESLMGRPVKEEERRGWFDVGKEDETRRWDGGAWETM